MKILLRQAPMHYGEPVHDLVFVGHWRVSELSSVFDFLQYTRQVWGILEGGWLHEAEAASQEWAEVRRGWHCSFVCRRMLCLVLCWGDSWSGWHTHRLQGVGSPSFAALAVKRGLLSWSSYISWSTGAELCCSWCLRLFIWGSTWSES